MPTFSLALELTRATVSSHFPKCARGSPPSSLPRQRPLWGPHVSKGATRQSSAMAAVNRISTGGEGVARLISAGLDERVREVLGFWTSREGVVRDYSPGRRHH